MECSGLSVTIAGRHVLDNLSLQVQRGITAVVGGSGSGKTTLLRAIAGFVPLHAGTVSIDGRDMAALSPEQRPVTLLFQEPRLFPALTVADNVSFGLRVRGADRAERTKRAHDLLADVGLSDRADDSISGLSGGEQQRVALARALCVRPQALLLDEPFSAVDTPRRRELRALVRSLAIEHETTMVVVTHDIRDVESMADTVAVLDDGHILQHDSVSVVMEQPATAAVADLTLSEERRPREPARIQAHGEMANENE